jgi:hypothetical protein
MRFQTYTGSIYVIDGLSCSRWSEVPIDGLFAPIVHDELVATPTPVVGQRCRLRFTDDLVVNTSPVVAITFD